MKFDVAVIGTGPGGGMAACRLAQSGMRVIVLEKCTLPRIKACGGALPVEVKSLFDWDITSLIEAKVYSIEYLYNYSSPKTFEQEKPSIFMVDRSRFDYDLIEKAVLMGRGNIILRDGFHVAKIEEDDQSVRIYGKNQEVLKADYAIAADGADSKTAKCLGLNIDAPCGLAMNAEVEVVPEIFEARKTRATFNFFCLPLGYGWIFPKNGYLSCGVGTWRGKDGHACSKALDDFLANSFPSGSIRSVKRHGHPIPTYAGRRDIATQRVCLVGDAANLVEPIMGEGIRYALLSGSLAADAIIRMARQQPVPDVKPNGVMQESRTCLTYQSLIHQSFGQDMDILYRYALPIFTEAPTFFYRKFIIQGYSYLEYFRKIAKGLGALRHHTTLRIR